VYKITVVPGDGIGPEVCEATIQVIKTALKGSPQLAFESYEAGADCYTRTGIAFPDETMQACKEADSILHGAAGLPGVLYPDGTESGQDFTLLLRKELDLYANIRPIRLFDGIEGPLRGYKPGEIYYVIVRENTEGLYASRGGGTLIGDEVATDTMVITRKGVERIVKTAAELSRQRNGAPRDGKHRVTVVAKSNVLRSFAFSRRVAEEVLADYPDIEADYALTDAMSVYLIERPDFYDVVVSKNFVGDLLSDLGAATVGGMGVGAASELGDGKGYFQSSHGTAPEIAGKGIANPVASVLSGASMLTWLGNEKNDDELKSAGLKIEATVKSVLSNGTAQTPDIGGNAGTEQATAEICVAL